MNQWGPELGHISELLIYASENGIKVDRDDLEVLYNALEVSNELNESSKEQKDSVNNANSNDDLSIISTSSHPMLSNVDVHKAYERLCKSTSPVNGRTISDSKSTKPAIRPITICAYMFFLLAIITEILGLFFGDIPTVESGYLFYLEWINTYVLQVLTPVFWGGLGSCIFLLKRFSDYSNALRFDHQKMKGWGPRIVLGSLLAGVIQYIYDPGFITTSGIDDNAIAFLVGLSVKLVYGVLEKTVDTLADKLNLSSIQRKRGVSSDKDDLKVLLTKFAAEDGLSDQEREKIFEIIRLEKLN
ncbi:hypothetical protein L1D51_21010 [Pseudoalteromonas shioyasakiensis]|uniref:hypothetical protein n=1 Tax=Pseudoalteromonas shioyasakiensis TaxID=1190813 RepID=UPI001EFCE5B6|nr:hypothetical protein [Pseudoalteromonas shioyasakiensis]MCG9736438.1 hypothetical protein [Pseudoalteromonas shioyasakiensis]